MRTSTIPTMSGYEEDFGDFPSECEKESKESLVGAYRAESTFDFSAGSGITTKFPPLSDGSTSWFKYEELIEDWLDLTVLELNEDQQGSLSWVARQWPDEAGTSSTLQGSFGIPSRGQGSFWCQPRCEPAEANRGCGTTNPCDTVACPSHSVHFGCRP